jgi:hypothetical protein
MLLLGGRPGCRWEDNIRKIFRIQVVRTEIGWSKLKIASGGGLM